MAFVNLTMFQPIHKIGEGGFGAVCLARKICGSDKGTFYALKSMEKKRPLKNPTKIALTEQESLKCLQNCPFVTKLYYTFQDSDTLFFAMEYVEGGTLRDIIRKNQLNERDVRLYTAEIALAIEALHSKSIIHRDIKPANILVARDGHIKLADFGLSKIMTKRKTTEVCGTTNYMAPEVTAKQEYGLEIDWWALGVVAYELMTGRNPFVSKDGKEATRINIIRKQITPPTNCSVHAQDFVLRLLEKIPFLRLGSQLGADEIKRHPFFYGVDWNLVEVRAYQPEIIPTVDVNLTLKAMLSPMPTVRSTEKWNSTDNFVEGFNFSHYLS